MWGDTLLNLFHCILQKNTIKPFYSVVDNLFWDISFLYVSLDWVEKLDLLFKFSISMFWREMFSWFILLCPLTRILKKSSLTLESWSYNRKISCHLFSLPFIGLVFIVIGYLDSHINVEGTHSVLFFHCILQVEIENIHVDKVTMGKLSLFISTKFHWSGAKLD